MLTIDSTRSQRIVKNTAFMYVRMFVVLVIGLYTSRIVLKTLGETDFGIYSLVGGVVTLFVFINQALNSATQRFIAFDLGLGDTVNLRKTFTMSINVYFIFSIILVILLETAGYYLLNKLNIEANRLPAANWVFQAMIFSTFVNMLRVPYEALITAHERMSFTATVGIIDSFLKLGIVYMLILFDYDKLKLYSMLFACITLIDYLIYRYYCIKHFSFISKYYFYWDKNVFIEFVKFSGLSLYEQVAVMLTYQGVDILLNMFFGVIVNAAMGITKQVQAAVFNFVSNFQGAMTPQITKSYAGEDNDYLTKLMIAAPKFSLFLIVFLSVPIYFNMEALLRIWLVNPPEYTVGFCKLILISSVFEAISLPLRTLIFAHGDITKYQLIIGTAMLMNLFISFILLKLKFDAYAVLWVRIFVFLIIDVIRIVFIRNLINITLIKYIKLIFLSFIQVVVISSLAIYGVHHFLNFPLIINLLVSFSIIGFFIFSIGLTGYEKNYLMSFVKSFTKIKSK